MKNNRISDSRIKHIKEQGYFQYSDQEVSDLSVGNRFAYISCTAILAIGLLTASVPILSLMLLVAFGGVVLPNHPFDYIYNAVIADRIGRPKLPKRSKQLKFACSLATTFIALTIYFFLNAQNLAAYIMGGQLVAVAALVSSTDICIPSIVYNWLFRKQVQMN